MNVIFLICVCSFLLKTMFADEAGAVVTPDAGGKSDEDTSNEVSDLAMDADDTGEDKQDEIADPDFGEEASPEPASEKKSEPKAEAKKEPDTIKEKDIAKEEAEKKAPEPAKASEFSDGLMAKGRELGFTDAEIKAFGSPDRFIAAAKNLANLAIANYEKSKSVEAAKKEAPPASTVNPEDDFNIPDTEEYDPEIRKMAKAVKSVRDTYGPKVEALENQLAQATAALNHLVNSTVAEKFDGCCQSKSDFKDLLGEGDSMELDPNSDPAKNRSKIIQQMTVLQTGYRNAGMPVPSVKKLFDAAFNSVFANELAERKVKQEQDRIVQEANSRASTVIHKPIPNKVAVPKDPEKEGIGNLAKLMKERGIDVEDGELNDDVAALAI